MTRLRTAAITLESFAMPTPEGPDQGGADTTALRRRVREPGASALSRPTTAPRSASSGRLRGCTGLARHTDTTGPAHHTYIKASVQEVAATPAAMAGQPTPMTNHEHLTPQPPPAIDSTQGRLEMAASDASLVPRTHGKAPGKREISHELNRPG